MRLVRSALIASILAFGSTASAFTPENGTWWNPAEPGLEKLAARAAKFN